MKKRQYSKRKQISKGRRNFYAIANKSRNLLNYATENETETFYFYFS